jgi:hypothetical protein
MLVEHLTNYPEIKGGSKSSQCLMPRVNGKNHQPGSSSSMLVEHLTYDPEKMVSLPAEVARWWSTDQ